MVRCTQSIHFRSTFAVLVVIALCVQHATANNTTAPVDNEPTTLGEVKSLEDLYNLIQAQGVWALPTVIGGILLLMLCCCTCCIYRCVVNRARSKLAQRAHGHLQRANASIQTMTRRLDATPSRALRLMNVRKEKDDITVDIEDSESDDGSQTAPPTRSVRPVSKRIPESYGRIDKETQERIQSIRMSARLKPIIPVAQSPNAKALRMMGITEQEAEQRYAPQAKSAKSVESRMKKLALGAGGGLYSTGLGTAKFGNQIGEGFAALRARNAEKARKRKEEEEAKASAVAAPREDFRSIRLKPPSAREVAAVKPAKPAPPAAPASGNRLAAFLGSKDEQYAELSEGEEDKEVEVVVEEHEDVAPGIAPGPNKLAAFLSTSSAPAIPDPESDADDSDTENSEIDDVL